MAALDAATQPRGVCRSDESFAPAGAGVLDGPPLRAVTKDGSIKTILL
jgi:hypothetical protein